MNWDETLVAAILNSQGDASKKAKRKGFWLVLGAQTPRFYAKILWELITTFVVYSPGTNLLRTILLGVNQKWTKWNPEQQSFVVGFLKKLDSHGEVRREFEY